MDATEIEDLRRRLAAAEKALRDRAAMERASRDPEEKYRTIFESIDEGFCLVEILFDAHGKPVDILHLDANPAYERHTGLKDIVGRRALEIAPEAGPWLDFYGQVARTGTPARIEPYPLLGRWITAYATRVGGEGSARVAIVFNDVTERVRAGMALRESEEKQAFLLGLADALRPLSDPVAVMAVASETLGRHLGVGRCGYGEVDASGDFLVIARDWTDGVMDSLQGTLRLADFGDAFISAYRAGKTVILDDIYADARGEGVEAAFEKIGALRASLAVPLVKTGHWVAVFYVQQSSPRHWTRNDEDLVQQVAERTWAAVERARAEAALQESETRFRQFANASAAGLWIRDAATLRMEFASPAVGTIYGIEPQAVLGAFEKWAAIIVPEDREAAIEHIERARSGESVVHEFRIRRPSDQAFRWVRDSDFPLDANGRIDRIGGIAEDVTDAKLAIEHQAVLLAELQHRVRNIMAIIRSIAARSARGADSVPQYAELLSGRLLALARVQALLTRGANVRVDIGDIVRDEVSVQAQHDGQYTLIGPRVALSPKTAEVLTLAVHELATNALKYGGLSVPNGQVTVRWETLDKGGVPWLAFDWTDGALERAAPETPRRRGFGSDLIEGRIPYELKGTGRLTIGPGGATCRLEFPLTEGASVLETGAPQRATVFGGALDMAGETDLGGRSVLVVEDEYYLASDVARALQGAGAEVVGPFSTEDEVRSELQDRVPDAVVLDINLGMGATFKLAEALKDRSIPFVFVTGYDQAAIPREFDHIQRLEKPVQLRQIVTAVSDLLARAA